MIYRVVTVWRDQENDIPIVRSAIDFDAIDTAEQYIGIAIKTGFLRVETTRAQMPGGGCLAVVYVPIGQIIGWYLYELPDTTPQADGRLN